MEEPPPVVSHARFSSNEFLLFTRTVKDEPAPHLVFDVYDRTLTMHHFRTRYPVVERVDAHLVTFGIKTDCHGQQLTLQIGSRSIPLAVVMETAINPQLVATWAATLNQRLKARNGNPITILFE